MQRAGGVDEDFESQGMDLQLEYMTADPEIGIKIILKNIYFNVIHESSFIVNWSTIYV